MQTQPTSTPRWRLAIDRYSLLAVQAKVGARILARAVRHPLEPKIHPQRDFGNFREKGPQRTQRAANADEAARILAQAYEADTPLNVGGAIHSSNGHTLSAGGVRLLLDAKTWEPPKMLPGERVEAPGPMTWGDLDGFLAQYGRACPVLTDHLSTSIGGTLSVGGGIGTRSVVGGRQLDQVQRLRLLLPTGESRWVCPDDEPDLFCFALGGQGLLGIIDRVVMGTVARRPFVAQYRLQFRTLREAARSAESFLRANTDTSLAHLDFVGPILDSSVVELTLGFEFATRRAARQHLRAPSPALNALPAPIVGHAVIENLAHRNHTRSAAYMSLLTAEREPHVFLWNDFFFPTHTEYDRFLRYAEEEAMPRVGNRHLMAGLGLTYPHFEGRPSIPMSGLVTRPGHHAFSIGFNYAVPARDHAAQEAIRALLDDFQQVAPRMGGKMYRYGYSNAGAEALRAQYGADYDRLFELKAEVDPRDLLNRDVLR